MYIYDYYIIIYDKLFKYQKHYEEFISKKIINENNNFSDKQIECENNNFSDKQIECENNNFSDKQIEYENNNFSDKQIECENNNFSDKQIECENLSNDLIKLDSEINKIPKLKTIKESINWIRKIYTKLIFLYHPDKQIDSNNEIFSKIKNDFDKNNYSSIFYYFIKNKNHPYLSKLFNEMMQDKRFIDSLLNLSNHFNFKLNKLLIYNNFIEYLQQHNLLD
jgi:hypothetical protein